MSRSAAIAKLAKAAHLSAEAAKLYAEAAEELGAEEGPDKPKPTDLDVARARKILSRLGSRA